MKQKISQCFKSQVNISKLSFREMEKVSSMLCYIDYYTNHLIPNPVLQQSKPFWIFEKDLGYMKKYLQGVSENQKSPANTLGEKKFFLTSH